MENKRRYSRKSRAIKKNKMVMYKRPAGIDMGYDGAIKLKIHATYDITAAVGGNKAYYTVNWAGNGVAAGAGGTARLTVTNEFTNYNTRYSLYKVVGCKIKVFPIVDNTSTVFTSVGPIWSGSNS